MLRAKKEKPNLKMNFLLLVNYRMLCRLVFFFFHFLWGASHIPPYFFSNTIFLIVLPVWSTIQGEELLMLPLFLFCSSPSELTDPLPLGEACFLLTGSHDRCHSSAWLPACWALWLAYNRLWRAQDTTLLGAIHQWVFSPPHNISIKDGRDTHWIIPGNWYKGGVGVLESAWSGLC